AESTPSLPGGIWTLARFSTRPKTLTVPLMFSGWTISLMPLARLVTNGLSVDTGRGNCSATFLAHDGRVTSGFFDEAKFSAPPKLLDEIGLSEACGVRMAEMA